MKGFLWLFLLLSWDSGYHDHTHWGWEAGIQWAAPLDIPPSHLWVLGKVDLYNVKKSVEIEKLITELKPVQYLLVLTCGDLLVVKVTCALTLVPLCSTHTRWVQPDTLISLKVTPVDAVAKRGEWMVFNTDLKHPATYRSQGMAFGRLQSKMLQQTATTVQRSPSRAREIILFYTCIYFNDLLYRKFSGVEHMGVFKTIHKRNVIDIILSMVVLLYMYTN